MSGVIDVSRSSERFFFVGRKNLLSKVEQFLTQKPLCILVPAKGIFCPIGKTSLAKAYGQGKSIVWIQAKNFSQEFQKIQDVFSRKDTLLILDGVKEPQALQDTIPLHECQILMTSRQHCPEDLALEVGPLELEEAIEFLYRSTGQENRDAAAQVAEALDRLPTSLDNAARLISFHQSPLENYFILTESLLDENGVRLQQIGTLPPRNKSFTGRELALVNLEDALNTNSCIIVTSKRKIAAKTGLGGIGKTQIALQYAYRNAEKYPNLVFWINGESETTLNTSYFSLAEKLGVFLTDDEKKEEGAIYRRVNQTLERLGGYLLIYDNADDQSLLKGRLPQVGGHVLITSRSAEWDLDKMKVFEVGVFKRKESIALIRKVTPLTEQEADRIADLVQNLPIAVAQAAAYIRQTQISVDQYVERFEQKSRELLSVYQKPTDEFSKTIHITWQISMDKILEKEKEHERTLMTPGSIAAPLMEFCAFLSSRDISQELLLEWYKANYTERVEAAIGDVERTLGLLRDYYLVEGVDNIYAIHPLVQNVIRDQLENPEIQKNLEQGIEIICKLKSRYNIQKKDHQEQVRVLVLNCEVLLGHYDQYKMDWKRYDLLNIHSYLGSYHHLQGEFSKVFRSAEKSLQLSKELYPNSQHYNIATSLNNMGLALGDLGRHEEALQYKMEALERMKQNLGPTHLQVAMCLNNVGTTLGDLGRHEEALAYKMYALDRMKRDLGPTHIQVATSLNNVGTTLGKLGRYEEAFQYKVEALELWKQAFGPAHPAVAIGLDNVGVALEELGRSNQALQYKIEALELRKRLLGFMHPAIEASLDSVSITLEVLGRHEEALQYKIEALKLRKQTLRS